MSETTRTRRLRKYEADDQAFSKSGTSDNMAFCSPFGPLIAKTSIPDSMIHRLNAFADQHIASGESCEFALSEEAAFEGTPSLAELVSNGIKDYVLNAEGSHVSEVQFEIFWVVSQIENTPSPVHFHSGDISGVLYLKTPDEIDDAQSERNYISGRKAGFINFIEGNKQRFSKSLISFEPKIGDLYIFPGWLLHGAEPFLGKGERRSLAFNAFIKTRD